MNRVTTTIPPVLLTIAETASALRCCRAQDYRLIANDGLPTVLVGTRKRVPYAGLIEWAAERMIILSPPPADEPSAA